MLNIYQRILRRFKNVSDPELLYLTKHFKTIDARIMPEIVLQESKQGVFYIADCTNFIYDAS